MADAKGLVKSPFTISKNSDGSTWVSADFATSTNWNIINNNIVAAGARNAINIKCANSLIERNILTTVNRDCIYLEAEADNTIVQKNRLITALGYYGVKIIAGNENSSICYNDGLQLTGDFISDSGTNTVIRNNIGYTGTGDVRLNAGNIEMWNSTAWVIIGP